MTATAQYTTLCTADPAANHGRIEVAFVDTGVAGWQSLVDGIRPGVEVVLLDAGADGLALMADWAESHAGYDAIHVLSHGSAGSLQLGTADINTASLADAAVQARLTAIGQALTAGGDLLLYGCSVATGESGQDFIDRLASATGADVAASNDTTGAAILGGDWQLEASSGGVAEAPILTDTTTAAFGHILGDVTLNATMSHTATSGEDIYAIGASTVYLGGGGNNDPTNDFNAAASGYFYSISSFDPTVDQVSVTYWNKTTAQVGVVIESTVAGYSDFYDRWANLSQFEIYASIGYICASSFTSPGGTTIPAGAAVIGTGNAGAGDTLGTIIFLGEANTVWDVVTVFLPGVSPSSLTSANFLIEPSTAPKMTSAAYDASTGTLAVTGTNMTAGDTIDVSKLTLKGEGGNTYTLTTGNVTATNATSFSVTLNATDQLNVEGLLNKNGTSSAGGTTFNLAGAASWDSTAASPADNYCSVTVSSLSAPTITSATYDAGTGVLAVTGTNLVKASGVTNDITVSKLTLTGEGGVTYTLTAGNVEITDGSSFSVTLNATDLAALNQMLNKTGTTSTGGTTFNLAAADDWNTVVTGGDIADATSSVTVSNPTTPTITSATYDASTGVLAVTGTGFLKLNGGTNDIDVSKLTLTGEGGTTYTLTTANVEIASGTAFSVTLNATDLAAVNQLLNKNGTSSTGATTYSLAAAEDWAAGADSAVVVADTTGNGVTVSNVAAPTITSATYDASTGVLAVTGTGFLKLSGVTNDIDVTKLTLTGEGGTTYTLTTANVEITSGTAFSVTLNATDLAAVSLLINKNGTSSTDTTTYNLAAAEDWAAGADSAVVVADLAGNGITVSNVPVPTITSATYDYATNTLVVTGTGFLKKSGVTNDIDISKLAFTGAGGASHTLTSASDVEIDSATQFTVTLAGADLTGVEALLDKDGTASAGGTTYNLSAAEDWAAGADAALNVADTTGNGITVSNWAAPTITSATYDISTGQLVLTGTNFVNASGATNDVIASKLSLSGQGGGSYTLTDSANVEITSATSATLAISATDKLNIAGLLNKNGTAAGDATTYNLAAAEDWLAGSPGASDIADATTGITVSNVQTPTITSAVYDSDSGVLVVTGTNFFKKAGAANDIDVSTLTFTGGTANATYTLTSASDVEITSATSFSVTLSGADKTNVDALLDQLGTVSTGGSTYNLAAAEDWLTGADAAANIADASNAVTVTVPSSGGGGGSSTPTPPAGTPTGTYDGVTVTATVTTGTGGTTTTTVTIPVVPPGRVDDPTTPTQTAADIPLALDNAGAPLLQVSVPTGVGLSSQQTSGGSQTLRDILIAAADPRIADDTQFQQVLQEGIDAYVPTVDDQSQVTVRTISFSAGTTTVPTHPIVVTGAFGTGEGSTTHPDRQEALVIDVRNLPVGTVLQLDDVEFAIIVGATRVTGGDGRNFVVGDGEAQFIVLGAEDDELHGGGGDDTVASRAGADRLFGDAGDDLLVGGDGADTLDGGDGDDILQGGQSDAGTWTFGLGTDGRLHAAFTPTDAAIARSASESFLGDWGGAPDARIAFLATSAERAETVALLYHAVLGELPTVAALNAFTTGSQSEMELAQLAYDAYLAQAGVLPQAIEAQVSHLIAHVWGDAAATETLVQAGTDFILGGGSWAAGLLNLARAAEHRDGLFDAGGNLPLARPLTIGETGWSFDAGDDVLHGRAGNDTLVGGNGDDVLDGGAGTDRALLVLNRDDYGLRIDAAGNLAVGQNISGDSDTLIDVEQLVFADATLDVSCSNLDGPTLQAAAGLYRLMSGDVPPLAELDAFAAGGGDLAALAASLAAAADYQAQWGGLAESDLVQHLAVELTGSELGANDLAYWTGCLGDDLSTAELFVLAVGFQPWLDGTFAGGMAIG
jgi:hypothetical protein